MTMSRRALIGVGLFGLLALIWVLGVAPSAGPDEPSHTIRAGALVRGQFDGEFLGPSLTVYEMPNHVGYPDPGCFAFDPLKPATCATTFEPADGNGRLVSTSASYPIWGHIVPGVGTLLPDPWSGPASRLFDAAIPILLLVASLLAARRRGRLPMAATAFAITVPLWFSIVVVNPSGVVVAGGIALWTGMLSSERVGFSRLERFLVVGGWVAMALPRRDGMVYAALIVAATLLITSTSLADRWRQIGRSGQAVVLVSTVVMMVWALGSPQASTKLLVVVPLVPLGLEGLRRLWSRVATTTTASTVFAGLLFVVGLVGSYVVMSLRGAGFDSDILQAVIGQTGTDLNEAVGLIGWLDTPVPQSMVFLWLVGLGALLGAAVVVGDRRMAGGAVAVVAVSMWVSWVLTMLQNDTNGLYWQGRYYLPFLVGVPLLLGHVSVSADQARRLARLVSAITVVVLTVGFGASMRRWGVGVNGSLMPWRWDTYDTLVPPVLLLWFHVLAAFGLWWWLNEDSDHPSAAAGVVGNGVDDDADGVNIVGYHHVSSGLGNIARQMSVQLRRSGMPTTDVDIALTNSPQIRPPEPIASNLHRTSIVVATASELSVVLESLAPVVDASDTVVAYWFWELGDVPDAHVAAAAAIDEVWTPSHFVADAYRRSVTDRPVRLVPVPLTAPTIDQRAVRAWRSRLLPQATRRRPGHLFLVSLDLLSIVERKNPFAAIEAFRLAFDDAAESPDDVRLVIKTINGERAPDDLRRIVQAAADDDRIVVLDDYVSASDLDALIAAADCYVSLHRSEGLGLHPIAAMWAGTPVLATNYSGSVDYMDEQSAALVGFDLVPVEHGQGSYPSSSTWADPHIDAAATWMRRLVAEPSIAASIAHSARRRMETQAVSTVLADEVRRLVKETARVEIDAIR